MKNTVWTDENGRQHDYSNYSTERLLKIWWFCGNREITDIVLAILKERGVENYYG